VPERDRWSIQVLTLTHVNQKTTPVKIFLAKFKNVENEEFRNLVNYVIFYEKIQAFHLLLLLFNF